jgi:hypothetical protein
LGGEEKMEERSKSRVGALAEHAAVRYLRCSGIASKRVGQHLSAWDIETIGGLHIEVKASVFSRGKWVFNVHRHGILTESGVDYYMIGLTGGPLGKARSWLTLSAPIGVKSVALSFRTLLTLTHIPLQFE